MIEIFESLRKVLCSYIKENYYVFDFFDEVFEEIGKNLNIDFSKKFMRLKEIKKVLGEIKKGDFLL